MLFIQLGKFTRKHTKEDSERTNRELRPMMEKKGIKSLGAYITLGKYDTVVVYEAPDEKAALWLAQQVSERASTETLVALKREDALKVLEEA
jgi:uncharacterized protein with GYD domain